MSHLRCSWEHDRFALARVKYFWKSLSLPVPTAVAKWHQQVEDAIRAFSDYSKSETSMKTTEANLANAKKALEIQLNYYQAKMQEFKQVLKES